MVTGGISNNFSDAEQWESKYGQLSEHTVVKDRNSLLLSLSILLEDKGQYNKFRLKVV
jgi:hypothetical protein